MTLVMHKGVSADELRLGTYEIGFHGEILDDRGKAAVLEIGRKAKKLVELRYDPESFEVQIDAKRVNVDAFPESLAKLSATQVVLEATTLGFVEILLCCRALDQLASNDFDVVYGEPQGYRSPFGRHLLHRRDFELSGDVPGCQGIPGHAVLLGDRKPQKGVFFVVYEESRLGRAFEDLQMIRPSESSITFGIPAFKPGWEMDSIANNIDVIREQNIRGGVYFCGAAIQPRSSRFFLRLTKALPRISGCLSLRSEQNLTGSASLCLFPAIDMSV